MNGHHTTEGSGYAVRAQENCTHKVEVISPSNCGPARLRGWRGPDSLRDDRDTHEMESIQQCSDRLFVLLLPHVPPDCQHRRASSNPNRVTTSFCLELIASSHYRTVIVIHRYPVGRVRVDRDVGTTLWDRVGVGVSLEYLPHRSLFRVCGPSREQGPGRTVAVEIGTSPHLPPQ